MTNKIKLMALLILGIFVASCGKEDDPVACVTTGLTYNKDIKPILSSCAAAGCHVSAAAMQIGSYANYADTKASVAYGRILGAIKHSPAHSPMPKNGTKLSDCNISKIEAWIAAGLPE
jgi:cytochrome c553